MKEQIFVLKGIIVHTPAFDNLEYHLNEYVICENGKVQGIFKELPEEYKDIKVYDYSDKFIIPGMSDMHLHAPQYGFRGMGMVYFGEQWKNWFPKYSLPEERRYADMEYATKAYERLVDDILKTTTTTRAVVFATIHRQASEMLMDKFNEAGLGAYIGKVNMDRNSLEGYQETTEESLSETERWILETKDKYELVKPIITPRYIPSCTDELMIGLGKLAAKYNVPCMSHLSESPRELEWVKALRPDINFYAEAYDKAGVFGSVTPSLMAHVVYPCDEEYELMKNRDVMVAHCPNSNMNTTGGSARVKEMMKDGIKVGLGSDVAAGPDLSLMRELTDAIRSSKALSKYSPKGEEVVLSLANAFYIATMGGGQFFGKVGCFEKDYDFDAVVLDYKKLEDYIERDIDDRFERLVWLFKPELIEAKYVAGNRVL